MITYTDSIDGITAGKLKGFFVGWRNPPSQETHLQLLRQSDEVILAIEGERGQVVGFITAITDHVLSAYIPLLEVLPDYQHQGIATELVRRMLDRFKGSYMIDLTCDAELQPFYERFGMGRATGMKIRDYERQSGN